MPALPRLQDPRDRGGDVGGHAHPDRSRVGAPLKTLIPESLTAPISDDRALSAAVEDVRASGRFGIDTEFMRERTYRARLCLVQIATPGDVYLIDPLAGLDLSEVASLIADPRIGVVLHAGRQDLEIFFDMYGAIPANVFDVQMAAGFAGYGASLPYARLVETLCSENLTKGESYTDWCRRPLSDAQLSYAADDVRYLLKMAEALSEKLAARGRVSWATEEMLALECSELYDNDPGEAWRKVNGKATLSGRQAAILKEVARWREETAASRDIPRGWLVKDPTLVEIARRAPDSVGALRAIRGINPKEAERSGPAILAAVLRGRDEPALQGPAAPPRSVQQRVRILSGLADAVVRARCERAEIAPELVATRSELETLLAGLISGVQADGAAADASPHRLLTGWRRDLVGEAVAALASGQVAVRATTQPPYIEEVKVR